MFKCYMADMENHENELDNILLDFVNNGWIKIVELKNGEKGFMLNKNLLSDKKKL